MRKPVMPMLQGSDDLTRHVVPPFKFQIRENTAEEVAAARSKCPDDILAILGMSR